MEKTKAEKTENYSDELNDFIKLFCRIINVPFGDFIGDALNQNSPHEKLVTQKATLTNNIKKIQVAQ